MPDKLPTERQVLRCIFDAYRSDYPGSQPGENDPYVPIDVEAVAAKLACRPELLFGYLYYYLDHKYRHEMAPHNWTHLFALKVGNRRHCVNYPYLAGILAAREVESSRSNWALATSILAIAVSLLGLAV